MLSAEDRDRLKVLDEAETGHPTRKQAGAEAACGHRTTHRFYIARLASFFHLDRIAVFYLAQLGDRP
jgi:hypothetical protein